MHSFISGKNPGIVFPARGLSDNHAKNQPFMKKILLTVRATVIGIVMMVFQLYTASGQVATIQNWTNVYHGTSQSQVNLTYSVPTGSNTNRVLIVAVSSSKWTAGQITVNLTYGGQILTLADGDMGTATVRQHTALYYLNEAGLDAATNSTLSFTISAGGATMCNTDVWAAVFDYVNQASPLTNTQTYSSGTGQVTNFQFGTALTINAYNQAVEVVNSYNPLKNTLRTIYYATDWTMVSELTAFYNFGLSGASIRNGVANRIIPNSNTSDVSATTFSASALASMTALSLNYEIPPPPTIQTSNITFSDVTPSSFTINWTSGNGTNRIVLVKSGSAVDSDPVNGTTYTASDLFGDGSQIGTGNYVVYNGSGYNTTVYNLDANTTYHVAVYEFSGPPGIEFYLLTNPARGSQLTGAESAVTDDYRSNGSGNWGISDNWQTYTGSSWVTAVSPPSSSSGVITIRNGDTINVAEALTSDQVVIEAGAQVSVNSGITWTIADGTDAVDCIVDGTLYNEGTVATTGVLAFNSGSEYRHDMDGGTIPTATWNAASTCIITGITGTSPSGFNQSFGNFTWNCSSQTTTAAMNSNSTVQGDFILSGTGSGKLSITDSNNPYTLTISGNFFQNAGIFDLNSGSTSSAVASMIVAGNFSFTGGSITESSSGRGSLSFNGNGQMQVYTYGGTFANTIDFTVADGAYLQMGTGVNPSYISLSNGTFTLSSGATLGITDRWGITTSFTGSIGGNIRVTGTRSFNTGANYIYNGSNIQSSGDGLPATVNSLVFDNSGGAITLNIAHTINSFSITTSSKANLGTFIHLTSSLSLGGIGQPSGTYGYFNTPTFFESATGTINNQPPAGTWLGGTSSDWNTASNWVGGVPTSTTNVIIPPGPMYQPVVSNAPVAECNNLTIESGATLTINPLGNATVTGTLTNNGTLDLKSDPTGMFSLLLGTYAGSSGTVNSEIYMTGGEAGGTGSGMYRWHYFAVPSQQSTSAFVSSYGDNLMRYDDAGSLNDKSEGFKWSTDFTDLVVKDGYSYYYATPITVTLSGNSLLNSLGTKTLNYVKFGWNLLGNSLTCGINWDNVTFTGNVDHSVYFIKDYVEYYYITGGPGLPYGSYNGHIPPLQGFFVQALATGAGIDFSSAKEHNATPYYKGNAVNNEIKESLPVLRLTLGNANYTDETAVWFNNEASMRYDNKYDAGKWLSEGSRPQFYSFSPDKEYAINGIPFPETAVDIPLAFKAPESGSYSINQIQMEGLDDYVFYLKDRLQNKTIRLNDVPKYSFSTSKGTVKDRFILTIRNISAGPETSINSEKPFNIYQSSGLLNIELISDAWEGSKGSVKVIDISGRPLFHSNNMTFSKSSLIQLPVTGKTGLFIIELASSQLRYTGRVIVK